jgi:hypothetical protein
MGCTLRSQAQHRHVQLNWLIPVNLKYFLLRTVNPVSSGNVGWKSDIHFLWPVLLDLSMQIRSQVHLGI